NQDQFSHVFGQTGIAVLASMSAYLVAQFIDIRIFHFWKKLTGGKKLWLRNNFSTMSSQFFDTLVVLLLLCWGGEIEWSRFKGLLLAGFMFKVIVAALDTPILYLAVWMIRRRFGLRKGEEISFS
ncbi:MAG: queuosine precursor transporter, partial [Bacteroidota bacterium]